MKTRTSTKMGGKKVSGRGKKSLQGRATPLPLMVITVLSPSVFQRTATRGETKKSGDHGIHSQLCSCAYFSTTLHPRKLLSIWMAWSVQWGKREEALLKTRRNKLWIKPKTYQYGPWLRDGRWDKSIHLDICRDEWLWRRHLQWQISSCPPAHLWRVGDVRITMS